MIFKFIDAHGYVHHREVTQVTFLGCDEAGHEAAVKVDGEPGEILHYDDGQAFLFERYFVVYPPNAPRQVIAAHMQGAWLMSDEGKTVDNLMFLPEPQNVLERFPDAEGRYRDAVSDQERARVVGRKIGQRILKETGTGLVGGIPDEGS